MHKNETSATVKPHTHAHTILVRVYYEDTDAGGIVYHASSLRFAERGRTEFLRFLGWDHRRLAKELAVHLIVRRIEIDYKAPARLDDALEVHTSVAAVGNTSLTLHQTITREGHLIAGLKVVVVAVTPEAKAVRLPPQLRQIFGDKLPPK